MSGLVGRKLGHYRIVEMIGAGGMGEVYRAHDDRLDRDVAIKVLPEAVAQDRERLERFEREARAAAALDHPNILAVHDLGEHRGRPFMVTEYLEGHSLRDRLRRGPLPESAALACAVQVAEGLAAAHDRGITHRDLKPENVFLSPEGRATILDFGLAKLDPPRDDEASTAESPTESLRTAEGAVVGTIGYMPPEQVRGEPSDARSDIFSLGVVLYEMLSGCPPFTGRTTAEVAARILRDDPHPMSDAVPRLAPALHTIVARCLEKQPDARFQSVRDLVFALQAVSHEGRGSSQIGTGDRRSVLSIAVLPFSTVGAGEEDEYLGDGLTEGIIGRLCGLPGLDRVLAWHSVIPYKGTDMDPALVGRELAVEAVLVGTIAVRRTGMTISAELVSTEHGDRLWGHRSSGQLSDLIEVEDAISKGIADSLRLVLSDADQARIVGRRTEDPEAYRRYLKGRHLWNRRTRKALERSIELYREAIALDPAFALAYTGIADSWVSLAWNDFIPKRTAFKEALSAALTALEIDDTVAESHVSLGGILVYLGADWARAEKEYRRAIELYPNDAEAYHQYAHLLSFTGRGEESISMMTRAIDLEPVSRIISSCCGQVLYFARRYDEAVKHLETAIELDPANAGPYSWLGMVHVQLGNCERAEKDFERGLAAGAFIPRNIGALGYCHAIHGHRETALAQLDRLVELSRTTSVDACFEAWIRTGLGEIDDALGALEKGYANDANWLVALKVDPFFERLRGEAGFQDLLERMNLSNH